MRTNIVFTSYRRSTSGNERIYSASATITNGIAYMIPVSGEMASILGLDYAVKSFFMFSKVAGTGGFQKYDKIVVSKPTAYADTYFVESVELAMVNNQKDYKLIIKKDE